MAATAFRGEVSLPGGGVANQYARSGFTDGWRLTLSSDGSHYAPDICGHGFPVRGAHGHRGHPRVLTGALDDGDNQFAILVAESHLRAQQVGTAQIAASQIRAVTTGATYAVQRLAALNLHGVARRTLLAGNQSSRPAYRRRDTRGRRHAGRWSSLCRGAISHGDGQ